MKPFPYYDNQTLFDWCLANLEGAKDTSWSNDACPSISIGEVRLFIDYRDTTKRDHPKVGTLYVYDHITGAELATESPREALSFMRFLAKRQRVPRQLFDSILGADMPEEVSGAAALLLYGGLFIEELSDGRYLLNLDNGSWITPETTLSQMVVKLWEYGR